MAVAALLAAVVLGAGMVVVGDGVPLPLTDTPGDAARGRAIVESRRLNPDSLMPALHRTEGLQRVGAAWAERPVLDAQQVEDVVAYLRSLK